MALVAAFLLTGCGSNDGEIRSFTDLWLTADQQGRWHFERQAHAEAAQRFEDAYWKGVAFYRAGEFESAVDHFARLDSPDANFNLGNTYAQLGRYEEAVASYDMALAERPGWIKAQENRKLVVALIVEQGHPDEEPPASGDPAFSPDQVVFDEMGEKGERGQVEAETLTDEQMAEMWLRRLQTTPAEFLRRRFTLEMVDANQSEAEDR